METTGTGKKKKKAGWWKVMEGNDAERWISLKLDISC